MSSSNISRAPQAATAPISRIWTWLRPYGWAMSGAGAALLVSSIAELGLGLAAKDAVDHGFLETSDASGGWYFGALFGVIVVYALATFYRVWFVKWLGERVVADIRKDVFAHLLQLSPAYYDKSKTSTMLSWLAADASVLQLILVAHIPGGLRSILVLLGGCVLMMVSSLKLAVILLVTVPILVAVATLLGHRVRRLTRTAQDEFAAVHAMAEQSLGAIRTVQAFTNEARDQAAFDEAIEKTFLASRRQFASESVFSAATVLFLAGLIAAVLSIGARDVVAGDMTPGELTAFVFYAALMASALGSLSGVWAQLQRAAGAAERLLSVLDGQAEIEPPAQPVALPAPLQGDIRFDAVTFAYPARPQVHALDSFSLNIAAGETVAFVGPTGAGKSTVFSLLLRFYDPTQGGVELDGVDLRDVDPRELREQISYVAQDPVMFDATVADNIRYGRPDATDEEVEAAAETAWATEFIQQLPDQFETRLGERGVQLSGGQRQRLAIARAVLRQSRILLFDEATSSLDASTEHLVQQALDRARENRTALIIAHRLNTVRKSDRIVVMDRGRVVAIGSHDELVRDGGIYAQFAKLQMENVSE